MPYQAGRAFGQPGRSISSRRGRQKGSRGRGLSSVYIEGPVEYGRKNSHVGGYSAEDIASQHDARDYQEIDAEEVDTQVESCAGEGRQHRFPSRHEHGPLGVRCRGRVPFAEVEHLEGRTRKHESHGLYEAKSQSDHHERFVDSSEGDVEGEGRRDPNSNANNEQEFESQESRELVVLEQSKPADCGVGLPPCDEDDELDRDNRHSEQGGRAPYLVEPVPTRIFWFCLCNLASLRLRHSISPARCSYCDSTIRCVHCAARSSSPSITDPITEI